ncbi:hypothetical protein E2C01_017273 [Portunus trituberculatus]|uniref:Uncharacterized protein n=1 Tax=Portunus trituberculatus TaxID=210409 RepID=A0A5B7DTB2_PORTR|nr:hypothetical protein [Portunus trituberculatus]
MASDVVESNEVSCVELVEDSQAPFVVVFGVVWLWSVQSVFGESESVREGGMGDQRVKKKKMIKKEKYLATLIPKQKDDQETPKGKVDLTSVSMLRSPKPDRDTQVNYYTPPIVLASRTHVFDSRPKPEIKRDVHL